MKILKPIDASSLKIRCHLCNKPVDRVTTGFSEFWHGYIVTVFCHGDEEVMRMGMDLLIDEPDVESQITGQEGTAFIPKSLPLQPSKILPASS